MRIYTHQTVDASHGDCRLFPPLTWRFSLNSSICDLSFHDCLKYLFPHFLMRILFITSFRYPHFNAWTSWFSTFLFFVGKAMKKVSLAADKYLHRHIYIYTHIYIRIWIAGALFYWPAFSFFCLQGRGCRERAEIALALRRLGDILHPRQEKVVVLNFLSYISPILAWEIIKKMGLLLSVHSCAKQLRQTHDLPSLSFSPIALSSSLSGLMAVLTVCFSK